MEASTDQKLRRQTKRIRRYTKNLKNDRMRKLRKKQQRSKAYNLQAMSQIAIQVDNANAHVRQACHVFTLVTLCLLPIIIILIIANVSFWATNFSWDPTLGPLVIDSQGCDVHVFPASGDTGQLEIDQFTNCTQTTLRYAGSSNVKYVRVTNGGGCADTWMQECKHVCLVNVWAPASADLRIYQDPSDTVAKIKVVVHPGTVISSLRACDWDHYCPTLDFEVYGATVSSLMSKTGGRIWVQDSDVTSATLDSNDNSVYVLDAVNNNTGLAVYYRQPEYRVALRAYGDSSVMPNFTVAAVFAQSACNITINPMYDDWSGTFDKNLDGTGGYGVTATDFVNKYNTDVCCGSYCPVYSFCQTHKWALFPSSTDDFRTFSDLASEILRLGITQAACVPQSGCIVPRTLCLPHCATHPVAPHLVA